MSAIGPVLEVVDLQRSFGTVQALRGVSFTVEPGEIVGLLGPNGAGKTTAMRVLTGFLAPTGGTARVGGHDVLLEPLKARQAVGYLPETAPVPREMTPRGLLDFVGAIRGMGPAERARASERVAADCGLTERLDQPIGQLSKGFRQRVGLAQALIHDPPVVILDEPTSGLDPNQIAEIRGLIRRVGERRAVLLSTHVLPEVQAVCDRVLLLHQGRLVIDGATEDVLSRPSGMVVHVVLGASKVQADADALQTELGALDGVDRVELGAPRGGVHHLVVHAGADVREGVFRWAATRGHVLLELSSERRDLEDVFRQLTGVP